MPLRMTMMVAAAWLSGCGAPAGERLAIETRSPYDFAQMASAPRETIDGRLVRPDGYLRGAVILSHGAAGPGTRQRLMAEWLAERGVASLTLDHFSARGVGSVVADQLRVPEQTMIADLFAARDRLATETDLPPERIGAFGWSKGATAVTLAAVDRLAGFAAPDGARFGFVAAYYPFCGFSLDDEAVASPLLLLVGGADDWTPSGPCVRQAGAWTASGQPVEIERYEGARHGFDSTARFGRSSQAIAVRDTSPRCTLTVDGSGVTRSTDGRHRLDTVGDRKSFLAECGSRGTTFEGDGAARVASFEAIERLLDRWLSDTDG